MSSSPFCWNGDARLEESYVRALQGASAHLLHTDPPYCLLTRRRRGGDERDPKHRKIERGPVGRFESVRDYRHFTEAWLPKAVAHLVPDAPVILWTNFLGKAPLLEVARACGYGHFAGEFRWCKRTTDRDPSELLLRVFEVALVLFRTKPAAPDASAAAIPWSVVGGYDEDGTAAQHGNHPNHKPFSVLEPLLRTYSRPGDLVLDCFAGSGSIPAAALKLGRRTACLEIEPEWAARVTARLEVAGPAQDGAAGR